MSDHALLMFWDLRQRKVARPATWLLLVCLVGLLLSPPDRASDVFPYQVLLVMLVWDAWVLNKVSGGRMLLELGVHDVLTPGFLHRFVAVKALRLARIVGPFALLMWWTRDDNRYLMTALLPVSYAAGLYWLFTVYACSWPKKVGLGVLAIFLGSLGLTTGSLVEAGPAGSALCAHLLLLAVYACWGPASLRALLQPLREDTPRVRRRRPSTSENAVVFRWGHRFPIAWLLGGGYLALTLHAKRFEPVVLLCTTVLCVVGYTVLVMERERRSRTWELLVATGLRQSDFLSGWRQHLVPRLAALLLPPALAAWCLGWQPFALGVGVLALAVLFVGVLEASTLAWMARQDAHCFRCAYWLLLLPASATFAEWLPEGYHLDPTRLLCGFLGATSLGLVLTRRYLQARCFGQRDWLRPFLAANFTKERQG